MTFIRLHFVTRQECWINADQIEAVIQRLNEQGEPIGSSIRTTSGTRYTQIAQTPDEVFELVNQVVNQVQDG